MEQIRQVMNQLISISEDELNDFLRQSSIQTFKRKETLSFPNSIPNEIFFINKGLVRVLISDHEGTEHTIHFALENQFISDYSNFLQETPSFYTLQALEETEVVVLPRSAIAWGYKNLKEGEKMGRLIAEYYYIYQDNRIKNTYLRTPKERYESISDSFPNIHGRVPATYDCFLFGYKPSTFEPIKKSLPITS